MTVIIVIKQSEVELSQLGRVSSYCATERCLTWNFDSFMRIVCLKISRIARIC